ncbi:MAG TPA: hypothetical protein VIX73_31695 [Kofleriaceae bacterium]|jgi:hypothetical protein
MAHQFDTGQPAPQRTRLQQGVIQLLSGLKKSNGGYLVEVMAFPFSMETAGDEDEVRQFVMQLSRAPSIAVHVGGRVDKPNSIGGYSLDGEFDLHVYFSSNNMRSSQIGRMEIDTAGLANDQADPGIHIALEHARELLIGRYAANPGAGADIKQLRPMTERAIITAQQITIWEQLYKVRVFTTYSEFRTVTQLLTSIRSRITQNPADRPPPAAPLDKTSIDVNDDNLSPP